MRCWWIQMGRCAFLTVAFPLEKEVGPLSGLGPCMAERDEGEEIESEHGNLAVASGTKFRAGVRLHSWFSLPLSSPPALTLSLSSFPSPRFPLTVPTSTQGLRVDG